MGSEIQTLELDLRPPESWTTYGTLSISRATLTLGNQNPVMVRGESLKDAHSALAEVEAWLRPASMETLSKALGEIYIRTARQKEASEDRKTRVLLYARELQKYPADLALAAMRRYRGVYFPALAELETPLIEGRARKERALRARALRAFIDRRGEPAPKHISPAERADVSAALQALKAELAQGAV